MKNREFSYWNVLRNWCIGAVFLAAVLVTLHRRGVAVELSGEVNAVSAPRQSSCCCTQILTAGGVLLNKYPSTTKPQMLSFLNSSCAALCTNTTAYCQAMVNVYQTPFLNGLYSYASPSGICTELALCITPTPTPGPCPTPPPPPGPPGPPPAPTPPPTPPPGFGVCCSTVPVTQANTGCQQMVTAIECFMSSGGNAVFLPSQTACSDVCLGCCTIEPFLPYADTCVCPEYLDPDSCFFVGGTEWYGYGQPCPAACNASNSTGCPDPPPPSPSPTYPNGSAETGACCAKNPLCCNTTTLPDCVELTAAECYAQYAATHNWLGALTRCGLGGACNGSCCVAASGECFEQLTLSECCECSDTNEGVQWNGGASYCSVPYTPCTNSSCVPGPAPAPAPAVTYGACCNELPSCNASARGCFMSNETYCLANNYCGYTWLGNGSTCGDNCLSVCCRNASGANVSAACLLTDPESCLVTGQLASNGTIWNGLANQNCLDVCGVCPINYNCVPPSPGGACCPVNPQCGNSVPTCTDNSTLLSCAESERPGTQYIYLPPPATCHTACLGLCEAQVSKGALGHQVNICACAILPPDYCGDIPATFTRWNGYSKIAECTLPPQANCNTTCTTGACCAGGTTCSANSQTPMCIDNMEEVSCVQTQNGSGYANTYRWLGAGTACNKDCVGLCGIQYSGDGEEGCACYNETATLCESEAYNPVWFGYNVSDTQGVCNSSSGNHTCPSCANNSTSGPEGACCLAQPLCAPTAMSGQSASGCYANTTNSTCASFASSLNMTYLWLGNGTNCTQCSGACGYNVTSGGNETCNCFNSTASNCLSDDAQYWFGYGNDSVVCTNGAACPSCPAGNNNTTPPPTTTQGPAPPPGAPTVACSCSQPLETPWIRQDVIGEGAPPTSVCGCALTPVYDTRSIYSTVSVIPSPLGGSILLSQLVTVQHVSNYENGRWTWSYPFIGTVYVVQNALSITLTFAPPVYALYVYTEPRYFSSYEMKLYPNGDLAYSEEQYVEGQKGARGVAYCTVNAQVPISNVTIVCPTGCPQGYAFGELALSIGPAPTSCMNTTPPATTTQPPTPAPTSGDGPGGSPPGPPGYNDIPNSGPPPPPGSGDCPSICVVPNPFGGCLVSIPDPFCIPFVIPFPVIDCPACIPCCPFPVIGGGGGETPGEGPPEYNYYPTPSKQAYPYLDPGPGAGGGGGYLAGGILACVQDYPVPYTPYSFIFSEPVVPISPYTGWGKFMWTYPAPMLFAVPPCNESSTTNNVTCSGAECNNTVCVTFTPSVVYQVWMYALPSAGWCEFAMYSPQVGGTPDTVVSYASNASGIVFYSSNWTIPIQTVCVTNLNCTDIWWALDIPGLYVTKEGPCGYDQQNRSSGYAANVTSFNSTPENIGSCEMELAVNGSGVCSVSFSPSVVYTTTASAGGWEWPTVLGGGSTQLYVVTNTSAPIVMNLCPEVCAVSLWIEGSELGNACNTSVSVANTSLSSLTQGNAQPGYFAIYSGNAVIPLSTITIQMNPLGCSTLMAIGLLMVSFCNVTPAATGMCCARGFLQNASLSCYDNVTARECSALELATVAVRPPKSYAYEWTANTTCAASCRGLCSIQTSSGCNCTANLTCSQCLNQTNSVACYGPGIVEPVACDGYSAFCHNESVWGACKITLAVNSTLNYTYCEYSTAGQCPGQYYGDGSVCTNGTYSPTFAPLPGNGSTDWNLWCTTCDVMVGQVYSYEAQGYSAQNVSWFLGNICRQNFWLGMNPEYNICNTLVEDWEPLIVTLTLAQLFVAQVCQNLFPYCAPLPGATWGACCLPGEPFVCLNGTSAASCSFAFGTWQGNRTLCDASSCQKGACCTGTNCTSDIRPSNCSAMNGTYFGSATCNGSLCSGCCSGGMCAVVPSATQCSGAYYQNASCSSSSCIGCCTNGNCADVPSGTQCGSGTTQPQTCYSLDTSACASCCESGNQFACSDIVYGASCGWQYLLTAHSYCAQGSCVACCVPGEDLCDMELIAQCTGRGGFVQPLTCESNGNPFCGLCCDTYNDCSLSLSETGGAGSCAGTYFGPGAGTSCPANACGACCESGSSTCTLALDSGDCPGNYYPGSSCGTCGACCYQGVCSQTLQSKCSGSWSSGVTCASSSCGTCCASNGACSNVPSSSQCTGGGHFTANTQCSGNCGACCDGVTSCVNVPSAASCPNPVGSPPAYQQFMGAGNVCSSGTSGLCTGACCFEGECSLYLAPGSCAGTNQVASPGITCNYPVTECHACCTGATCSDVPYGTGSCSGTIQAGASWCGDEGQAKQCGGCCDTNGVGSCTLSYRANQCTGTGSGYVFAGYGTTCANCGACCSSITSTACTYGYSCHGVFYSATSCGSGGTCGACCQGGTCTVAPTSAACGAGPFYATACGGGGTCGACCSGSSSCGSTATCNQVLNSAYCIADIYGTQYQGDGTECGTCAACTTTQCRQYGNNPPIGSSTAGCLFAISSPICSSLQSGGTVTYWSTTHECHTLLGTCLSFASLSCGTQTCSQDISYCDCMAATSTYPCYTNWGGQGSTTCNTICTTSNDLKESGRVPKSNITDVYRKWFNGSHTVIPPQQQTTTNATSGGATIYCLWWLAIAFLVFSYVFKN